jgi:hypothetical protein
MKPTPTTFIVALAAAAVLAASGCSGSDDSSSDTTAPTVASVPDTGPTTSFNVPQVTAETVPTTTRPADTTAPPPTTAAPPVAGSVEEAVANAAIAARDAYLYAIYNVEAADAADRLRSTTTGASLDIGLENYQALVDNGWRARPNPDVPDAITIESAVEVINDTTARLTICVVGAGVVYAPGAAEDGSDVIINDEIEASLDRVTLVLVDSAWLLQTGTNITLTNGATSCANE